MKQFILFKWPAITIHEGLKPSMAVYVEGYFEENTPYGMVYIFNSIEELQKKYKSIVDSWAVNGTI